VDWIVVAQNGDPWRTLVNTVISFGFHKIRGNSLVGEQLAASQEWLSSMESLSSVDRGLGCADLLIEESYSRKEKKERKNQRRKDSNNQRNERERESRMDERTDGPLVGWRGGKIRRCVISLN
jgi:hypothetical protein